MSKRYTGRIPYVEGKRLDHLAGSTKTHPLTQIRHFDGHGNSKMVPIVWKNNTPFYDKLTFVRFSQTYSGTSRALLESETLYETVEMFLSCFEDAIPYLKHGYLEGMFDFRKHGQSYCISYIGPKDGRSNTQRPSDGTGPCSGD
jgi:hypothetical protein